MGPKLNALFARGQQVLPGGVCSSTRLNQAVEHPLYAARAEGARFWDVDGKEYLDMSMSHGAALLGHGATAVKDAFEESLRRGVLCSFDTESHVQLAEQLCEIIPCADRVRFTNSGSEATLHALRLCRAASGRDRVIRFFGHFHGYHEFTFVGGHPPREEMNASPPYRESQGIPAALAELIIPVEYNDFEAAEAVVLANKDSAGTILVEPVDYNCGCILPEPGFLEHLRALADEHDMLLFFDEVQSFAKKSAGGAQQDFGVTPDICTIGKSLGGSLPLSAILGRADLMDQYAPNGRVAHSGTFNAPLPCILAGLHFVEAIREAAFWDKIAARSEQLFAALEHVASESPIPVRFQGHGSRFGIVFGTREPVRNYRESLVHDRRTMLTFCRLAAERGVYFHDYGGGPCHHGFSIAHTESDIESVVETMKDALATMAN